ncbi:phosphotransferase [Zhihengliuella sp.]|uniref:phosphotransferase n=1 Tax=Zhihengliuella sp. TaxID=1954483 RepID=UPI002811E7B2|nr:phosphotransferase [Zhihengliuella sp.]
MELAAIATAAVPGLSPVGVAALADDADDFDSALVRDSQNNQWRIRAPRHDEASMRLETELAALRSFTPAVRAALPFRIPSIAGTVRQGPLRTFVYNHLDGFAVPLDELIAAGGTTAANIGRAIAAIHSLPEEVVDRADLPVYSADQFRQRRLNELDQAATTGKIPSRLLRRWEHALEDVGLWRFNPTVVHGDLHEDHLLVKGSSVTAVTGWTDLRIGDPADDLAWLAAASEPSFSDAVVEAYVAERGEKSDPHIMRRAALAAEFALAQWLSKALAGGEQARVHEAEQMLIDLDQDIAEYGGQPISVVEPPRYTPGEAAQSDTAQAGAQATAADEAGAGATPLRSVPAETPPSPGGADAAAPPAEGRVVELPPVAEPESATKGPDGVVDDPAPGPGDAPEAEADKDGAAGNEPAGEDTAHTDSAAEDPASPDSPTEPEAATSDMPIIQIHAKKRDD